MIDHVDPTEAEQVAVAATRLARRERPVPAAVRVVAGY
jgi:hypothetical protein